MYKYFVDLLLYIYLHFILTYKVPSVDRCLLPSQQQIANGGNWTVLDDVNARPGQNVSYYAKVQISCVDGFQAYPAAIMTCMELRQQQPQCLEILSPIPSSSLPPTTASSITEQSPHECTLPAQQIENGNWTVLEDVNARPGQNVASDTKVQITCIDGFKAYPAASLTCQDLIQQPPPQCLKTCPSIATTFSTNATCKFQGNNTSCEDPYHGSTAIINCIKHYENRNNDRKVFTCRFGAWNFEPKYECEPVCGQKFVQAEEHIINGNDADFNEFTWQVALYEQTGFFEQICGGTILTPKITLSAGHCFKKRNNPELYFIGAGKTFRNYLDPRDTTSQYSNISNLIIPEFFSTHTDSRYDNDIAIIVLTTPFEMNEFVMPACLDRNIFFKDDELAKSQGTVVGWGFTEPNGSPSDRLKYLEVDYKSNETCVLKHDFKRFYFPHVMDKICAGILNEDTSACKGDSGGGLVFKGEDDRFYVRGIVSIGPQEKGSCDASQYTLYTSVSYHINFILEQIAKYNVIDGASTARKIETFEDGCILPRITDGRIDQPKTAAVIYDGTFKPGFPVPPGVEIQVTCNSGFRYYPEDAQSTLTCNKTWSSEVQCKRYCDEIEYVNGIVQCEYQGRNVSCAQPYDTSVALISCKDLYLPTENDINPIRFCEDGFWSDLVSFGCLATCGLKFVNQQGDISSIETKTSIKEFPWNVVIYKRNTTEYLCTGTLIYLNYVLTPAHCVKGMRSKDVYIAAGQSILSDSFEPHVQTRTANRIIDGPRNQIPEDTVLLRLDGDFELTKYVQAICLHYGEFPLMDKHGFVPKWVENDRGFKRLHKVEVVVRENHMCNVTNDDGMKICAEILGDPVCFDPTGEVIAFKDGYSGEYFVKALANLEQKTNDCTSRFRTFSYARFHAGRNDWRNMKITN